MPEENNKKALAIILARANSKGLKHKNIRTLHGKPLLAWTIEVALAVPAFERVIVSTDSERIAQIARDYGAEVPFLRPEHLGGDSVRPGEVEQQLHEWLREEEGYVPDFSASLYPTHPFRQSRVINELVNKGLQGFSPVYTARRIQTQRNSFVRMGEGGTVTVIEDSNRLNEQGMAWVRSYGTFYGHRRGRVDNPYCHVLDHPAELIDIDSLTDLVLAEQVLSRELYTIA
ncbi:cytidylyltransferase domain-containing protein [Pseudodesulfovibrio pelocollis]|uniref:acylneuraminate cytidylyltransferase family protein n=1 Tax=Pseudodesulfovibrio pelocollis TaxID=3051432 RepID=UPI00255AB9D3|nr:acylneuraminate cytidylyltransferase family protein [Pseudodesulfovibrio sp. SB368]